MLLFDGAKCTLERMDYSVSGLRLTSNIDVELQPFIGGASTKRKVDSTASAPPAKLIASEELIGHKAPNLLTTTTVFQPIKAATIAPLTETPPAIVDISARVPLIEDTKLFGGPFNRSPTTNKLVTGPRSLAPSVGSAFWDGIDISSDSTGSDDESHSSNASSSSKKTSSSSIVTSSSSSSTD